MTNGVEYLSDGCIVDFDAWESTWEKAFTTLRVRDASKWSSPSQIKSSSILNSNNPHESGASLIDGKCAHPICVVEAGHTNYHTANSAASTVHAEAFARKQRETMAEILFEKMDAPHLFIAPAPALAAFSVGRQSGLVVDVGGGGCRATPIIDGLMLKGAQRRSGRGGEWLSDVQYRILNQRGIKVNPRYAVKVKYERGGGGSSTTSDGSSSSDVIMEDRNNDNKSTEEMGRVGGMKKIVQYPPTTTNSFHRNALRDVMYEMKTGGHCVVPNYTDAPTDGSKGSSTNSAAAVASSDATSSEENFHNYELPDGTQVDIGGSGSNLRSLPGLLFEELADDATRSSSLSSQSVVARTLTTLPLHKMAHEALSQADIDARKELCGNIILCGATTLFPNLEQRLSAEMSAICPFTYKCKIIAAKPVERQFASWIGASVLTSLGSFQQLWLSKLEYEEYGVTLGCQRFP
eukprot:CAMPEP_0195534008 /NCGR_PEP_ID=MMETSP0794_2-20130614/41627_1 /TAXON_ID=515487 /ORGANISM="Stephanopyxis turris, Strain CCMP 815" /LENGTH=462 /DNA_ID=CAMNT_0040666727 /DNA_START=60 /DNA_END=1448 /DNA_ORIENTATION=-